jgi:hypothetical protein
MAAPTDKERDLQEWYRDKYNFIVRRLKADIRFLIYAMNEFVDLPEGSWDQRIPLLEQDLEGLPDALNSDGGMATVDPLACLLNYHDKVVAQMLGSLLYEKALLYQELDKQTGLFAPSEPAMAEMTKYLELVTKGAKSGNPPERYRIPELPTLQQHGSFTFDPKKRGNAAAAKTSVLQSRLPAALRQMQAADRALRRLRFGEQVTVKDPKKKKDKDGKLIGKVVDIPTIRKDITVLFDKCTQLEHELQTAKAQRSETEVLERQLAERSQEKDAQLQLQIQKATDLDSKVGQLQQELASVRREKAELFEKYQKIVEESLPALDRVDAEMASSQEAVDRLHADAEMFSSMFRLQVDDNKMFKSQREEILKELVKATRQLKRERDEAQFKEDEQKKKGMLYKTTVEARQSTLAEYQSGKNDIRSAEERLKQQDEKLDETRRQLRMRDQDIIQLRRQLQVAHEGIGLLEKQKKFCLQEYESTIGKPYSMLLKQYEDKPKSKG